MRKRRILNLKSVLGTQEDKLLITKDDFSIYRKQWYWNFGVSDGYELNIQVYRMLFTRKDETCTCCLAY